jgi:hypothetical protein
MITACQGRKISIKEAISTLQLVYRIQVQTSRQNAQNLHNNRMKLKLVKDKIMEFYL